jgi:hypothetical protein
LCGPNLLCGAQCEQRHPGTARLYHDHPLAPAEGKAKSITCGYLSGVVLLGLIAQLFMPGWWWVDSVTSLAIVVLLVKEGREAWEAHSKGVRDTRYSAGD